jgi:hypothetical protein
MIELSLANPMVFDDKGGVKMHPSIGKFVRPLIRLKGGCAVKKDGFADKDVDRIRSDGFRFVLAA